MADLGTYTGAVLPTIEEEVKRASEETDPLMLQLIYLSTIPGPYRFWTPEEKQKIATALFSNPHWNEMVHGDPS